MTDSDTQAQASKTDDTRRPTVFKLTARVLTPLHIGTGETLDRVNDITEYFIDTRRKRVVLVDYYAYYKRKHIGDERRPVETLYKLFSDNSNSHSNEFADLFPTVLDFGAFDYDDAKRLRSLRPHILDANGTPYLPGSSLKGALRTALDENPADYNPENDPMRLLRVGDAYPAADGRAASCSADLLYLLNYTPEPDNKGEWELKPRGDMMAECLKPDTELSFKLSFYPADSSITRKLQAEKAIKPLKEPFNKIEEMFDRVNRHTKRLLQKDKEFILNNFDYEPDHLPDKLIKNLDKLLADIDNAKTERAVLRIGFGSGAHFMTGKTNLKSPRNNKAYLPYPKTRRINADGLPLGFVRITKPT